MNFIFNNFSPSSSSLSFGNLVDSNLVKRYNENLRKFSDPNVIYQQSDQDNKEEFFVKSGQICPLPSRDVATLQDELGGLRPLAFKSLVSENFYNPEVMRMAMCVTDSIFYPSPQGYVNTNQRIKEWIRNLRRIGQESVVGYAMVGNIASESPNVADNQVFVLKVPRDKKSDLLHELFIGLQVNELRRFVPNFAYVYGGFKCSAPVINDQSNNEVIAFCNANDPSSKIDYIVYENVSPSVSMHAYAAEQPFNKWLDKYLQILYALDYANKRINFTHYDLHYDNVLIRNLDRSTEYSIPYAIEGRVEYIRTDGVATMIDYGDAHLKYAGLSYGSYGKRPWGIQPNAMFPLHDSYKLLCFSMVSMAKAQNANSFTEAAKILRFFTNEDPNSVITNQAAYSFFLPYSERAAKLTNYDLIKYIRSVLPSYTVNIISMTPVGKVLACDSSVIGRSCLNSSEVKKLMGLNGLYADSVFEFYDLVSRLTTENKLKELYNVIEDFRPHYIEVTNVAIEHFNTILNEIRRMLHSELVIPTIAYTSLENLFDPKFLNDYKAYIYNLAKLYDNVQELLLYRDAISFTVKRYNQPPEDVEIPVHRFYNEVAPKAFRFFDDAAAALKQDLDHLAKLETTSSKYFRDREGQIIIERQKFQWWFTDLPLFAEVIIYR